MKKLIFNLCFLLLLVFVTAETDTLWFTKMFQSPGTQPYIKPSYKPSKGSLPKVGIKIYPKKKCAKEFRIWHVRNTPKGKDGKRPKPTVASIQTFWRFKTIKKGLLPPNFKKCLDQYQKDRKLAHKKYLASVDRFMSWFLRHHQSNEIPKVSHAEEWWAKTAHVSSKPNFVKFCARVQKRLERRHQVKKLMKFKYWWKTHKKTPSSHPTVADMRVWWTESHKKGAKEPNYVHLFSSYQKLKKEFLILKEFGNWWGRYGRRDSKTTKLKSPKAKDITQWWNLDANRRKIKVNFEHLANAFERIQREKKKLVKKVTRKIDNWWRRQEKKGEPQLEDIKAWYESHKSKSNIQPDFNKLYQKILASRGKRKVDKYLRAFHRSWIRSGPKGKDGKRLKVTIYDMKSWWPNYVSKRKHLATPDFDYLFKVYQQKRAKKQEKKIGNLFWNWWLQYRYQKKQAGVKLPSTPKKSYIKWWFNRNHFPVPKITVWFKQLLKNIKKSKEKLQKKKNIKRFLNWWKKHGNGNVPKISDIKTWYLRRKGARPGFKKPNLKSLLRNVEAKIFEKRFLKGFLGWWKEHGKKGKKPHRKDMVQYWKKNSKKGDRKPIFSNFILKLKKKWLKKRYEKYLDLFRKWWKRYNQLRNVKKSNPAMSHVYLWWNTQMKKVPKNKTPIFSRLYTLYNKTKANNKVKYAFLKYWESYSNKLPKLSDVKAWWARSKGKFKIRKPDFSFIKKTLIAKEHALNFRKWWKSAPRTTLPTKADVKTWIEEIKKKVKGFTLRNLNLVSKFVKKLFFNEKLPKRILRTYPELKFVHKKLIQLWKEKGSKLGHINKHLDSVRRAYLQAGSDLKAAENAKQQTTRKIASFRMLFRNAKNFKQKTEKQNAKSKKVANDAWEQYRKAKIEFENKKAQFMKESRMRRKEYLELTEKLKGIKMLISIIGPQHSVRVRRECKIHQFGKFSCSQQFCCNVKYFVSADMGEKRMGEEYCVLQGLASCKY